MPKQNHESMSLNILCCWQDFKHTFYIYLLRVCMFTKENVEVRGKSVEVCSPFLSCAFLGSNSGCQAWQQMSHQSTLIQIGSRGHRLNPHRSCSGTGSQPQFMVSSTITRGRTALLLRSVSWVDKCSSICNCISQRAFVFLGKCMVSHVCLT